MTPEAVKLLMKISACRLDESIAPVTFVDMLLELIELTHQTGVKEALGTDLDDLPAAPSSRIPLADDPGKPPPASRSTPKPSGRGGRKLDEETRQAIRYEADLARDDDGNLPRGFVSGQAAEHGVAPQTIYNILAEG